MHLITMYCNSHLQQTSLTDHAARYAWRIKLSWSRLTYVLHPSIQSGLNFKSYNSRCIKDAQCHVLHTYIHTQFNRHYVQCILCLNTTELSHCCNNPYSLGSNMSSALLLQRKARMNVNAVRAVPPINIPTCNSNTWCSYDIMWEFRRLIFYNQYKPTIHNIICIHVYTCIHREKTLQASLSTV